MAKREKIQDFVINVAAAGDNVASIPAPGVGFCIRVLSYVAVAAGATNLTWKTGATVKSGAMPLAANAQLSPHAGSGDGTVRQFQGGDNEALIANLSLAVQVSGHGTYQVLKTTTADFQ